MCTTWKQAVARVLKGTPASHMRTTRKLRARARATCTHSGAFAGGAAHGGACCMSHAWCMCDRVCVTHTGAHRLRLARPVHPRVLFHRNHREVARQLHDVLVRTTYTQRPPLSDNILQHTTHTRDTRVRYSTCTRRTADNTRRTMYTFHTTHACARAYTRTHAHIHTLTLTHTHTRARAHTHTCASFSPSCAPSCHAAPPQTPHSARARARLSVDSGSAHRLRASRPLANPQKCADHRRFARFVL